MNVDQASIAAALLRYSDHFEIDKAKPSFENPMESLSQLEDLFLNEGVDIALCERSSRCSECDGTDEACGCIEETFYFTRAIGESHSNCAYSIEFRIRGGQKPHFRRDRHIRVFGLPKDPQATEFPILEIHRSCSPPHLRIFYSTEQPVDYLLMEAPAHRGMQLALRFDYMSGTSA